MYQLLLIKLFQKVKNCNYKEIKDFGFEDEDFSNAEFKSACFEIHTMPYVENYNVTIRENGQVYLTQGDTTLFPITGKAAKKWCLLANELFNDVYENEIEEAKNDDAHNFWLDHQDTLAELQRHEY